MLLSLCNLFGHKLQRDILLKQCFAKDSLLNKDIDNVKERNSLVTNLSFMLPRKLMSFLIILLLVYFQLISSLDIL